MGRLAGDTISDAAVDNEQAADMSSAASWRPRWAGADRVLLALVALGAVLRFYGLGNQSLWYDENLTADATAHSLEYVIRHTLEIEGSAPPFFLGMWAWTQLFGRSPASLRFLPALAGVLTIPVVYAALRTFGQQVRAARVAALLVAVNPMLVWYSQEARPYALVAFAAALMLWGHARINVDPSRANWLLWAWASAAALALHYFAITLVIAHAAVLYWQRPAERRLLRRACTPIALTLAVLVPFALLQRSQRGYPEWVGSLSLPYRLNSAVKTAFVGPGAPDDRLWLFGLVAVVVAAVVLAVRASRTERTTAALLAGLGGFVVAAGLAGSAVGVDGVLARYLIASLIPLAAAVGIGLGSPKAGWVGLLAAGALAAVSIFVVEEVATEPALQRPDWRAIADVVDPDTGDEIPDGGTRVFVVRYSTYSVQPLVHLVDSSRRLNDGTADDVVEIDVIFLKYEPYACDLLVGRACNMLWVGGHVPDPLGSELTFVERFDLDQFYIERYRLPRPTSLDADDVLPPEAVRKSSVLVVE